MVPEARTARKLSGGSLCCSSLRFAPIREGFAGSCTRTSPSLGLLAAAGGTDEMVAALSADSAPAQHRAVDLVPVSLSTGVVLLTYRIDDPQRPSLRSSVWLRNADGHWLLRFHQGTSVL